MNSRRLIASPEVGIQPIVTTRSSTLEGANCGSEQCPETGRDIIFSDRGQDPINRLRVSLLCALDELLSRDVGQVAEKTKIVLRVHEVAHCIDRSGTTAPEAAGLRQNFDHSSMSRLRLSNRSPRR